MSTTRDITQVDMLEDLGDTEANTYVEHGGLLRRAAPATAREAIGLGGIVVVDGIVCMEIEE